MLTNILLSLCCLNGSSWFTTPQQREDKYIALPMFMRPYDVVPIEYSDQEKMIEIATNKQQRCRVNTFFRGYDGDWTMREELIITDIKNSKEWRIAIPAYFPFAVVDDNFTTVERVNDAFRIFVVVMQKEHYYSGKSYDCTICLIEAALPRISEGDLIIKSIQSICKQPERLKAYQGQDNTLILKDDWWKHTKTYAYKVIKASPQDLEKFERLHNVHFEFK